VHQCRGKFLPRALGKNSYSRRFSWHKSSELQEACKPTRQLLCSYTMGKPKIKQAKPRKGASSAFDTNGLPSFDESILSSLTDKIEKGFRSTATSKSDPLVKCSVVPPKESRESTKRHRKAKESPKTSLTERKRDAEGNVKEAVHSGPTPPKTVKFHNENGQAYTRDILMQEILALGGDEDDLDLVASIESSDEDANEGLPQLSLVDAKFTKGLSNFVAGLGINDAIRESGGDKNEDWKDTDSNITPAPVQARTTKMLKTPFPQDSRTGPHQKELNRLVSESLSHT
jgi:hypothetical protein